MKIQILNFLGMLLAGMLSCSALAATPCSRIVNRSAAPGYEYHLSVKAIAIGYNRLNAAEGKATQKGLAAARAACVNMGQILDEAPVGGYQFVYDDMSGNAIFHSTIQADVFFNCK